MKTFKTVLILLILVFAFTNGYSQKDKDKVNCKCVKEKKDDFTGEITKSTSRLIYFNNAVLGFRKAGEKYFVDFYIKIRGEKNAPLKEGEELQLKLENGEILTFKATKDNAPTTKVNTTSTSVDVYSTFNAEYSCTKDDLTKLGNSPATNLKVTIANESFPLKLGKGEGSSLQKDAYCITQ
jgi:hypothetical protein